MATWVPFRWLAATPDYCWSFDPLDRLGLHVPAIRAVCTVPLSDAACKNCKSRSRQGAGFAMEPHVFHASKLYTRRCSPLICTNRASFDRCFEGPSWFTTVVYKKFQLEDLTTCLTAVLLLYTSLGSLIITTVFSPSLQPFSTHLTYNYAVSNACYALSVSSLSSKKLW